MSEELSILLHHPDPRERALALSLDGVTGQDLALAILDPSPLVWMKAFYHPHSAHALDVLAAVSRDAAGNPIHDRHDLLLKDPRCHQGHIDSMRRAVEQDTYLPIQQQVGRLSQLKSLRKDEDPPFGMVFFQPSRKKIGVDADREPVIHSDLGKIYHEGAKKVKPLSKLDPKAGLGSKGAYEKVVYHIPAENGQIHKFIVKPYFHDSEYEPVHQGWNEATSQHLFHAANLGHVHQKSFVGQYTSAAGTVPATIIQLEKAHPMHETGTPELAKKNPKAPEEARKIAIMDFLTGNSDRHSNNLMVKDDGQLLAIDHGSSFFYSYNLSDKSLYEPSKKRQSHLAKYTYAGGPDRVTEALNNYDDGPGRFDYHNTIKSWWPEVSADVRRAFEQRLELVTDPMLKEHLEAAFMARHKWLDEQAKADSDSFFEALRKAVVQGEEPLLDEVPVPAAKRYPKLHEELLTVHPTHIQPKVDYFERNVNTPNTTITPEFHDLDGCESKALVKHGDNTYLIKSAHTHWSHLSGWAEMTNQAMYHAGGIGHLHQDVHATHLNIKSGNAVKKHPAVVIHFKPGQWKSVGDGGRISTDPKTTADLRKARVLDFLTGNSDRHSLNLLADKNGNAQVIDHGFCFRRDDWEDPQDQEAYYRDQKFNGVPRDKVPFNYGLFGQYTVFRGIGDGFWPDDETFDWWDKNKDAIKETFHKHLHMLPDKEERARRQAFFDKRFTDVEDRHPVVVGDLNKSELVKGAMARLAPFNPKNSPMRHEFGTAISGWVVKERKQNREQLGLFGMEPNARQRALQKLHAQTEVRRHPVTGEREFLLHRGHGDEEANKAVDGNIYDTHDLTGPAPDKETYGTQSLGFTSWMPHGNVDRMHTANGHVVTAWIPESAVSFYIPQYRKIPGAGSDMIPMEREVVVVPGRYEMFDHSISYKSAQWKQRIKDKVKNELHKSLGNAEFLHDQHYAFTNQKPINITGVHEKLMKAHPAAVNPGVRHFEIAINKHGNPVPPVASQKEMYGIQEKAMYSHNNKNYIVKPANEKATSLGAWNELTSQAMYHAGGIGHLHQKVHATVGRTNANRQEPAHALAIHAEPDSMTFFDAHGYTMRDSDGKETIHPSKDQSRVDSFLRNKQHQKNMGMIGVMDYLTSNPDRHGHNILLKKDGSPIAIDHSRSFWADRKHAIGNEFEGELNDEILHTSDPKFQTRYTPQWENHQSDSAAAELGSVDKDTVDWWEANKGAILDKFKEHVAMLPDPEIRQKMLNSYMVRHNRLTEMLNNYIYGGKTLQPVVTSGFEPTEPSYDKTQREVA